MSAVPYTFDIPLRITGALDCLEVYHSDDGDTCMAYEDVIPLMFFNPGAAADVIDILTSVPIPAEDRVSIFISWSKDVHYTYYKEDLDILRNSK